MRISRSNEIIGQWSLAQIRTRLADATLLPTDLYYDEEASDWLPLSDLAARQSTPKPLKAAGPPCYCGSGLPFQACHGDGSNY